MHFFQPTGFFNQTINHVQWDLSGQAIAITTPITITPCFRGKCTLVQVELISCFDAKKACTHVCKARLRQTGVLKSRKRVEKDRFNYNRHGLGIERRMAAAQIAAIRNGGISNRKDESCFRTDFCEGLSRCGCLIDGI